MDGLDGWVRFFFEKSTRQKWLCDDVPGAPRVTRTDKGLRNDGILWKYTHEWIDKNKTDGFKCYAGDGWGWKRRKRRVDVTSGLGRLGC